METDGTPCLLLLLLLQHRFLHSGNAAATGALANGYAYYPGGDSVLRGDPSNQQLELLLLPRLKALSGVAEVCYCLLPHQRLSVDTAQLQTVRTGQQLRLLVVAVVIRQSGATSWFHAETTVEESRLRHRRSLQRRRLLCLADVPRLYQSPGGEFVRSGCPVNLWSAGVTDGSAAALGCARVPVQAEVAAPPPVNAGDAALACLPEHEDCPVHFLRFHLHREGLRQKFSGTEIIERFGAVYSRGGPYTGELPVAVEEAVFGIDDPGSAGDAVDRKPAAVVSAAAVSAVALRGAAATEQEGHLKR